jgi:LysM domain
MSAVSEIPFSETLTEDPPKPRFAVVTGSPAGASATAPLRLTRRGRAVVIAAATVLAAGLASLIIVATAAGAQATNHDQPGGGYAGMREIVVRPGQTLWSIAAAAEPSADPRVVIQQIMTANSLTTTQIEAGQLLWVPK